MTHTASPRPLGRAAAVALAWAVALVPAAAPAHFLWITAQAPEKPGQPTRVELFLNEDPEPGGPEFLKYVRGVVPTAAGVPLAASTREESIIAPWSGPLPPTIDAERDLGLKAKGDLTYRLYYTARLQARPVVATVDEKGTKLRVRVVAPQDKEGKPAVQVLYDGKPAPKAKIKTYPASGEGAELIADDQGRAAIDGVAEGTTGFWATWTDPTPGMLDGKPFAETRYYATLHCPPPAAVAPATTLGTMPEPAVNSFGGAVLGDWLYVYSGHVGQTHQYSTATTDKHFRRLSLRDRTTWEDLPMGPDLQGVALVADGRALYRLGGMRAQNAPGQPQDMVSTASFARFDPEAKTWTELAPLPVSRSTHDAAVVGRRVYAVGGWSMRGAAGASVFLDDAVVFDLDRPDLGWKSIPQPFRRRAWPSPRPAASSTPWAGSTRTARSRARSTSTTRATGAWSTGPAIPGTADRDGFAASAFALDGRLCVSGLPGMIARLDAAGAAWEAVGAWSLPRITHRVLAGPDHTLLAVGGNYRGVQTPVIEAVTIPPPLGARRRTHRAAVESLNPSRLGGVEACGRMGRFSAICTRPAAPGFPWPAG